MQALVVAVALLCQAKPFEIDMTEVEGRIRKPSMFMVVGPPQALGVNVVPSLAYLQNAELRLAFGPRLAVDLLTRARSLAAAERARSDAEWRRMDEELAACEASPPTCPSPGPDEVAAREAARDPDFRGALTLLARAKEAPAARAVLTELLGLEAALSLELGAGEDWPRASNSLLELTRLVPDGSVASWAHLNLADRYFSDQDLPAARTHYEAAVAAEPSSPLGTYLRFKLAWTDFNLGDNTRAIAGMIGVVRESQRAGGPLGPDAERDLVAMFASVPEDVAAHIVFLKQQTGERAPDRLLDLATLLLDDAQLAAARAVLEALPPALDPPREQRRAELLRQLGP